MSDEDDRLPSRLRDLHEYLSHGAKLIHTPGGTIETLTREDRERIHYDDICFTHTDSRDDIIEAALRDH
jgi:hypothetical protein